MGYISKSAHILTHVHCEFESHLGHAVLLGVSENFLKVFGKLPPSPRDYVG